MTHAPETEELVWHLIAEHHCSTAESLKNRLGQEVATRIRQVSIVPAEGSRTIDITEEVGDELAVHHEDFDALHDGHHAAVLAARALHRWEVDGGGDEGQER
jgi:hypothetical protein